MVVSYGVKRWRSWSFFGAAGGCGSRGPRVVGQPAAAAIAGLRGRPAVRAAIPPRASQAPCPNNNSPDRSSPPGPGAPRMRRFYISARARRNRFRGDSCVLVSYVTLAYSAWSSVRVWVSSGREGPGFLRITRNQGQFHSCLSSNNSCAARGQACIPRCLKRLSTQKSAKARPRGVA